MGTRADFYIGRGEKAEWLGSTAWDGYPGGIDITLPEREKICPGVEINKHIDFPRGEHLFDSKNVNEFKERLAQYFKNREDVTLPERGWPWPWETSDTTDYAYAFDDGKVYASCFGSAWFDPLKDKDEDDEHEKRGKSAVFPNMKNRTNVRFDYGSGLIIFGG